eukprot:jgi/Undpi1/4616/HiC_scaffold_18.g07970.m1
MQEDKEGLIQYLEDGGDASSNHPARFTENTLVVANEQARDEPEFTIKLSPFLEKLLKEQQAGKGSSKKKENPVENVGINAAREASREHATSPELTLGYKAYNRAAHVLHGIKAKAKASNAVPSRPAPSSTPLALLPAPPEQSVSCPKNPWTRKPACFLKVGEKGGLLRAEDGRSAVWPGVDGSLRFGTFLTTPEEESGGGGVGRGFMGSTNLLASDSEKARQALLLRQELQAGREGGGEGGGKEKEGEAGPNWWSWRQPSKQSQREIATENAGEVCVSVSNKGCVKVTVDGTNVLSKSGRFAFDWMNHLPWQRPTDDGYEVHVVQDGIEVRLGERVVWGMNNNEWLG